MKVFRPVVTGFVLTFSLSTLSTGALAQTPAAQNPPPENAVRATAKDQAAQAAKEDKARDQAGQTTPPPAGQAGQGQQQAPPPKPEQTYKENVVVSASKTEQKLVDAPATMTVIGPKELSVAPTNNYADVLRSVPGLNITQISARDINVNSRGATSSLATGQLAVVDGRSIYQDFFGFTMWDFMPANLDEIKQVEVIRGPASAVWGANAMNGVINVITKTPREMAGTSVTFGVTGFDREVSKNNADSGAAFYVRGTHSQAVNDRWSYRVSAGIYTSDPWARPVGTVPNGTNTPYPPFKNEGTNQPKLDVRVDYDFEDPNKKLVFNGGTGGTTGIMNSGIGPFRINPGTQFNYWRAAYTNKAFKLQAFMNTLAGDAPNLLVVDPAGKPVVLDFDTSTFDIELGDSRILGGKHVLTYGGNFRHNGFTLSLAPGEDSRTEGGAYIQDEWLMGQQFRLIAGARVDSFSSIDNPVFSPRVALLYKPTATQSIRTSYNRAFRAPSQINNNLNTTIATPFPLGALSPLFGSAVYLVPTTATGNPDLVEESIDAFEVAYTANLNERASVSAAWFYTKYKDGIYFTPTSVWLTAPPGFPGIPQFGITPDMLWSQVVAAGYLFPSNYTYLNLGEVKNQGLELGVSGALTNNVTGFVTYTYQTQPDPSFPNLTEEQALKEINLPSQHQWGLGLTGTTDRYFGTVSVNRASRAFWQDVLDARYHGYTPANTFVNITAGTKFSDGRYSAALKIINLMNQQIQQHIFGDIVKRQVTVEFNMQLR